MSKPEPRNPALERMERSRVGLAEERNRAIQQVNALKGQMQQLVQQHQRMQQDMVRWIAVFLLLENKHDITFDEEFLKKADDWVVQRANDPEARTITWRIVPREEFEAERARLAAEQAKSQDETSES